MAAEEVLVLAGIEQVLRQLSFACQQAKTFGPGDGHPEPVAPADRAVAAVAALGQVEVCLEPDGAAMAAPGIGVQHGPSPPGVAGGERATDHLPSSAPPGV